MNSHITSNKHIGRNSFWLRCLSAELKVRKKCQRRWGPLPNAASGFCRGKDASKGQQKQRKIIQHLVDSGVILAFMGLAGFEPATFETWIPTILHGRVYPKSTYSWVLRGDLSESILSQWVGCTASIERQQKGDSNDSMGNSSRYPPVSHLQPHDKQPVVVVSSRSWIPTFTCKQPSSKAKGQLKAWLKIIFLISVSRERRKWHPRHPGNRKRKAKHLSITFWDLDGFIWFKWELMLQIPTRWGYLKCWRELRSNAKALSIPAQNPMSDISPSSKL